jgi:hypothetical protein
MRLPLKSPSTEKMALNMMRSELAQVTRDRLTRAEGAMPVASALESSAAARREMEATTMRMVSRVPALKRLISRARVIALGGASPAAEESVLEWSPSLGDVEGVD